MTNVTHLSLAFISNGQLSYASQLKIGINRKLIMSYKCPICQGEFNQIWRCRDCGVIICDSCSKGGNSSIMEKIIRIIVGILTLSLSEVILAAYRKKKQHCPNCHSKKLIKI